MSQTPNNEHQPPVPPAARPEPPVATPGAPTGAPPTPATAPAYAGPPAPPAVGPSVPPGARPGAVPPPAAPPGVGHAGAYAVRQPGDPFVAPGPAAPPSRTPASALIATAAAAALFASALTGGITYAIAFDDSGSAAPAASAPAADKSEAAESTTVPVNSTGAQPDWQEVADAVRPSVVAIAVQSLGGAAEGSGVILDADGHILTNEHVVSDARNLQVTLADGRVFEAEVVGTDPTTDLAVIALVDPPDDLTPAVLGDSDAVAVGAAVMAVGNPLGLDSTVTTGIVSALDRPVSTGSLTGGEPVVTNAIQIDAAVNPGNSGGPLFDASGRVIGITSSIASLSQGSTAGSIGLGFAIPVNLAERIAAELIDNGTAEHAFLGVTLNDGTATVDGTTRLGAVVQDVTDGSPAAEAGLEQDDVVVAIDDDPVSGALSLTAFVRERAAGDEVTLTVVRDGATITEQVTLAARTESVTPAPETSETPTPGR